MNGIVEIEPLRLVLAYIFLASLLMITWKLGAGREREITVSVLRMTLQLILTGYILVFIFQTNHLFLTLGVFTLMQYFAVRNIHARVKLKVGAKLRRILVFSLLLGTGIPIFFFLAVVVNVDPWYEARYFIPIAGMLIGNAMTGVALGAERLINGMVVRREWVEGALMLGATPQQAAREVVNDAFSAAIMPTISSMVGMGIVFLPGMMVGQILSGVSPLIATQYQIAIMLGIMGGVSLTVYLFMQLGYKTFFNRRCQLELPA